MNLDCIECTCYYHKNNDLSYRFLKALKQCDILKDLYICIALSWKKARTTHNVLA